MRTSWKLKTNTDSVSWSSGLRSLGLSMFMRDGMAAATMSAMTSAFLSAFALALGADAIYIGLLSAVPMILWTATLIPAALLCQKHIRKRKNIVVLSATASRLLWVPIILIAVLIAPGNFALSLLLIFVTLSTLVGAFMTPAWASLVGDLVPENSRGIYFSKRTIATTAASLSATLAAGWALDLFGKENLFGFAVIFAVGLAFGLMSSMFFSRIPSPPSSADGNFDLSVIKDVWHDSRFRTFLLLFGIWEFGIMLSAPFTVVYVLDTLRADYIWISIFAVLGGVAGIIVQRGWGMFSDRYGHRVVMIISAFGTVPAILLWIPATAAWMLIPVEVFSGAMWAGFSLSYYNYMLEISPSRSRAVFAAMFSVVIGVTGIVGPIVGGLLVNRFTTTALFGLTEYRVLFLVTGLIRLMSGVLFMLFLAEVVEKRERIHPGYVFGEMMRSSVQGGIMRAHYATSSLTSDVVRMEHGFAHAADIVQKDAATVVRAIDDGLERLAAEADKLGQKIVEGGTEWHPEKGETDNYTRKERGRKQLKKLRVKVSE